MNAELESEPVPTENMGARMWQALGLSLLLPVLLLLLYIAISIWTNAMHQSELRAEIKAAILADRRWSNTAKAVIIQKIDQINFNSPTWYKDPTVVAVNFYSDTYEMSYEMERNSFCFYASVSLVTLISIALVAILALKQWAKGSDAALIGAYQIAWGLSICVALINVILLIPLMAYSCFESTVLLTHSYFPKLILIIIAGGLFALFVSVKILLTRIPLEFTEPMSRELKPVDSPDLWMVVRAAAQHLKTAPPDHIVTGLQYNFYVTELDVIHDKGRTSGRTLYLSYPLMRQLDSTELMAIIGHELAHFLGKDTVLTNHLFPLRRRVLGTMIGMAHGGFAGWPSLQLIQFFYFCFEPTISARSRSREFQADLAGASITSNTVAARALVKTHVFSQAFNLTIQDSIQNPNINPLDIDLKDTVSARFLSDTKFWGDLFKQSMIHPLDSHPPLSERLVALGEQPDAERAKSIIFESTGDLPLVTEVSNTVFAELHQQAADVVTKIATQKELALLHYSMPRGRAALDEHFPPQKWKGAPLPNLWAFAVAGFVFTASLLVIYFLENLPIQIIAGFVAFLTLLFTAIYGYSRYHIYTGALELSPGGIVYSHWNRPLLFTDVNQVEIQQEVGKLVMIFHLLESQRPYEKSWIYQFHKKEARLSVAFRNGTPVELAETITRYYSRQLK